MSRLTHLDAGQQIPYGGDRVSVVSPDLAAAFQTGDRLVVAHTTGDLLHIPRAVHDQVGDAVGRAAGAFTALAAVDDDQITDFYERFAAALGDEATFEPIAAANSADVLAARARQRPVSRLELTAATRQAMVDGLHAWRDSPTRRSSQIDSVEHVGWSVGIWRAPLGVIGFVFEGRPNVFADATGVLRTGNTVVFRIGSDALGTARAIVEHAVAPSLHGSGLPAEAVQLVDIADRAAGWAIFTDSRLALAVARGSGSAVEQLGAVARQHGIPASLHGTGGAWIIAGPDADVGAFELAVRHSLDRKVCNTLNTCCIVRDRVSDLMPALHRAASAAADERGATATIHELEPGDDRLGHEWEWEEAPELGVLVVDSIAAAVEEFNRYGPHFIASLISCDPAAHDRFWAEVDAPFVGDGFTRWVDGQYALDLPELGLSNWQHGRLLGRGGVLSGDSAHTIRLRAKVTDHDVHR